MKIDHILSHREKLAELARLGCLFVVSAVESLSPRVLEELEKGHTAADVVEALRLTREAGIALRPSLVAFTPWTTLDDYRELCDFIFEQGLTEHVDPIQLAIRLLLPPKSALLSKEEARPWLRELVPSAFGYAWEHPDHRMDALHAEVSRIVEDDAARGDAALATFRRIRAAAYGAAGIPAPADQDHPSIFVPKLTEPWFCCAEPSAEQLTRVSSYPGESSSKGDTSNRSSENAARNACSTSSGELPCAKMNPR